MLSYQHSYHAGNLADVHKHALLAWALAYLLRKDKPITYLETHSGRGLYDLAGSAAAKTGEAAAGIEKMLDRFDPEHPYAKTVQTIRATHGPQAYPGSPLIAAELLRPTDKMHLAEMHPAEFDALQYAMSSTPAKCYAQDGFELAHSLCPPTPRRGVMLIDPSYEVKTDYLAIPKHIAKVSKAWNVGVICLWYPILRQTRHQEMCQTLARAHPDALTHEIHFPPSKSDHGMIGSGLFFINPPFGLRDEAARLTRLLAA